LKKSFSNLCKNYPNAFKYFFFDGKECWIGAFSEVLGKFNKTTQEFETMSLAGTIAVNENWSHKEIEEQKPVSDYIRSILENYDTQNTLKESETYDHISGNIKHLKTDFRLKINPDQLDSIISEIENNTHISYFVNLRCAKLYKNAVHLFVGGGITSESSPEKEWIETELKSEAVLKNLSFD